MTTPNDEFLAFGTLHFPLFQDLMRTDDTEKRDQAAFQLGVLRTRCEHALHTNPNPSRAEDALARAQLQTVNTWINLADKQALRHVLEGIAWGEQNQT